MLFDGALPLTAYDLPLYTPPVYLSQLAQYMDSQNVRVWKDGTAGEIVEALLVMARYVRPDIETARVLIAALHDMVYLYPETLGRMEEAAGQGDWPNAESIAAAGGAAGEEERPVLKEPERARAFLRLHTRRNTKSACTEIASAETRSMCAAASGLWNIA